MTSKITWGRRAVGAALLLVLLAGAAFAPAAAVSVAAVAPDLIDSTVFEYDSGKDPVLSTSLADRVSEVEPPITAQGRVMTTGDQIMGTDALRANGITGIGVKIGVISTGLNGATAAQTSGDLGWVYTIRDESKIGDGEGTAMLEIIHDIAPGATLYFHDCGNNSAEFIRAIDALVAVGCTVIVDDIAHFEEPYFEDGDIAKHLKNLTAINRILYITSAGNSATDHYQGRVRIDNEGLQDFSGTGSALPYLYANVPRGGTLNVFLQWDEPFGSAIDDFKIVLVDSMTYEVLWNALGNDPLKTSVRLNSWSNPCEGFVWINQDVKSPYHDITILVGPKGGASVARTLELYVHGDKGAGLYPINVAASDSIFGHQTVPDVITVAAVNASAPDTIEWYSSHGPATHLFPNSTVIQKPDISAPARVNVTGYGRFGSPFSGTSAAAPHIAALCALVWSVRQDLSPADIRSALYASAVDLGAPGRDTMYGWGRADAVAMYNLLATVNTEPPSAFKKFYPKGGLSSGSIGGMIIRMDPSLTVPDSPIDLPTTSPKKPPAKQFVRWYPGEN